MKRTILPFAIYTVFFTYTLFMIFFGNTGVGAFSRLNQRVETLSGNLETLQGHKTALTRELESLRTDSGAVRIEARSLGLYDHGQQVVYFRNLEYPQPLPEAGRVLLITPLSEVNTNAYRIVSLGMGLTILVFGLVTRKVRNAAQPGQ